MSEPTGLPPGAYDFGEPNLDGRAVERQCEESEFGLPVGYDDPAMYHGTAASQSLGQPQIGYGRTL
jgi:hypothetical protein